MDNFLTRTFKRTADPFIYLLVLLAFAFSVYSVEKSNKAVNEVKYTQAVAARVAEKVAKETAQRVIGTCINTKWANGLNIVEHRKVTFAQFKKARVKVYNQRNDQIKQNTCH